MIISKTPLRISFAGGGTDLPSYYMTGYGAVVNAAIDKYIYVIVKNSFDGKIHLHTTETEIVDHVDNLKHDITRACLKHAGILSGIEITSISDIPGGTGLGSSSCYTVGLLNALYAFKRTKDMPLSVIRKNPTTLLRTSPAILAENACDIEIHDLLAPIGKQDQYAAAFGGVHYFQFNSDDTVEAKALSNEEIVNYLNDNLLLFYIGGKRSANSILVEQNKNTSKNLNQLNLMRNQAGILSNDIHALPELLKEGWQLKKSLANSISNSHVDEIYTLAISHGALSGKLLGAGGAGFMLFYCPKARQNMVRDSLTRHGIQHIPVSIGCTSGSEIIYYG